jgi:hypothetical protein
MALTKVKNSVTEYLTSAAGAVARGFEDKLSDFVSVKDFGAKGDGITDDTAAIQAAVNSGEKVIFVPSGTYNISSTVWVPVGVELRCEPRITYFEAKSGGAFTGGFMFQWNTTDGSTWTVSYPNMNSGAIAGCQFKNTANVAAMRGVQAFCSLKCENLRFENYRQSIKKPSGFYVDTFHISDVICEDVQDNTEYQVELLGLGDGLYIKALHCPADATTTPLACRIRGCFGGSVLSSVGGDYLFEQSNSITFSSFHLERSQIISDSSSVAVLNGYLSPKSRIPIIIKGTYLDVSETQRSQNILKNICFSFVEGLFDYSGFDVQLGQQSVVDVDSCYKKYTANGDLSISQLSGISIVKSDGTTPLSQFNDLSYLLSIRSRISSNYFVHVDASLQMIDVSFPGINTTALSTVGSNATQWLTSTGTYYYKAQLIYDKTRLIGRNQTNAETSVVVSGVTQQVRHIVDHSTKPRSGFLRLYRGTATNSYDKYVDIPNLGSAYFYDNGLAVNGHLWQSRAASATDTINSFGEMIEFKGQGCTLHGAATPTVGSFIVNDKIARTGSTIDGSSMLLIGSYRLTSGSAHVTGTDWANMRVSHVSPAV